MHIKSDSTLLMRTSSNPEKAELDFLDAFKLGTNLTKLSTQLQDFVADLASLLACLRRKGPLAYISPAVTSFRTSLHALEPLAALLHESSSICLYSSFSAPRSAGASLTQCEAHVKEIFGAFRAAGIQGVDQQRPISRTSRSLLPWKVASIADCVRQNAEGLETAVMRLHHILMASATLAMQEEQSRILATLATKSRSQKDPMSLTDDVALDHDRDHDGGQSGFRRQRESTVCRQYTDPTLFDLFVIPTHGNGLPARGKMDCAGDTNVVAQDWIDDAGLGDTLEDVQEEVEFDMLEGHKYKPKKFARLHWRLPNDRTIRTTEFYVAERSPYQMIFGQKWMERSGVNLKNPPALLAIVGRWVPKAKRRQMNDVHEDQLAAAMAQSEAEENSYTPVGRPAAVEQRHGNDDVVQASSANPTSAAPASTPADSRPPPPKQKQQPRVDDRPSSNKRRRDNTEPAFIAQADPPWKDGDSVEPTAAGSSVGTEVPDTPSTLRPPRRETPSARRFEDSAATSLTDNSLARRSTPDPSRPSHDPSTDITPASSSDIHREPAALMSPAVRISTASPVASIASLEEFRDVRTKKERGFMRVTKKVKGLLTKGS